MGADRFGCHVRRPTSAARVPDWLRDDIRDDPRYLQLPTASSQASTLQREVSKRLAVSLFVRFLVLGWILGLVF